MSCKYSALGAHKNPFLQCFYFLLLCMYSSLLAMPNTVSLTCMSSIPPYMNIWKSPKNFFRMVFSVFIKYMF